MPGKCRLHRDVGGLSVAYFADHHDVGILPQYRAQACGKGHADFGIDLRLADTFDRIFDRVFYGQYVAGAVVQTFEACIKRCRLARTGGAGDQYNAIGLGQRVAQYFKRIVRHAEQVERNPGILLV